MNIRQGVILVGGRGTRLGALTDLTPKPLIEVAGRPFVEHVLAHLSRYGITEIILVAGYLGDRFIEAYHDRTLHGVHLTVAVEPEALGTAGALTFVADQLHPQFLMANGDTFFDADLLPFLTANANASATLLIRKINDAARYGRVILDGERVSEFAEKQSGQTGSGVISAGYYLLTRDEVLAHIHRLPCSIETQVMPALVAEGRVIAVEAEGYFVDMGVPDSLAAARRDLQGRRTRPAAFLDRDGVLNHDDGYTHRVEDLKLMYGAADGVRRLNEAGYYTLVVSNQGGIARGYYNAEQARRFNDALREALMAEGARLDAVYFCPHHPAGSVEYLSRACSCRKPQPGLLEWAAREWPVDPNGSFLIGDMATDLEAAEAFGIPSYQFTGGNLLATVETALGEQAKTGLRPPATHL